MATLRQYFDTDFSQSLTVFESWDANGGDEHVRIIARLHLDFEANAKYASCFVPACNNPGRFCRAILDELDRLLKVDKDVIVQAGHQGHDEFTDSRELRFTGRIFVYTESEIAQTECQELNQIAATKELVLRIRGPRFAMGKAKIEKPLAFISHDSRDKDAVARPIALGLSKLVCPVWFDEFSLQVGDSLRESIDKGLKECKKCILVLSPQFLSNRGWTKAEFNSIFTREILEKQNLVLPVWYEVSAAEVFEYCPSLADRVGVNWSLGEEEVGRRLRQAIV